MAVLPFFPTAAHAEIREFQGLRYHLYRLDPNKETLRIFWKAKDGQPINTFRNLQAELAKDGLQLKFAMNAGIYEPGFTPTGLLIQNGKTLVPLNRNPPPPKQPGQYTPNFYLKPNGVFFISDDGPGILETEAYAQAALQPRLATQSGPLLVENGKIHPVLQADSTSRLLRNGVGVTKGGEVIMISTFRGEAGRTNLHGFASLFLHLQCPNALYLDGDINDFYLRSDNAEVQSTNLFAGILAIVEAKP